MKLLLDQGLPRTAAAALREVGLDAVHVADLGMAAALDGGAYRKALNDPASPGHVVTVQRGAQQVDLTVPRAGN